MMGDKVFVADVDTVLKEWKGLEVKVTEEIKNVYGHKYYFVELPLTDPYSGKKLTALLSENQIRKVQVV